MNESKLYLLFVRSAKICFLVWHRILVMSLSANVWRSWKLLPSSFWPSFPVSHIQHCLYYVCTVNSQPHDDIPLTASNMPPDSSLYKWNLNWKYSKKHSWPEEDLSIPLAYAVNKMLLFSHHTNPIWQMVFCYFRKVAVHWVFKGFL